MISTGHARELRDLLLGLSPFCERSPEGALELAPVAETKLVAADGHNALAMLARREGETLNALLKRLNRAIGKFYDDGEVVDEINGD